MRKIIYGIVIALVVVYGVHYWQNLNQRKQELSEATALIEKEVRQTGKLIVTEGTFAQVFTYENSKKFYLEVLSAKKKALIVINAKVTVSYDLRQLATSMDQNSKTITITHIPEPILDINPDIEYYDVTQDYLNQFNSDDYNTIKKRVNTLIMDKVKKSALQKNAKNRLISELSNIFLLTKNLGWTLRYNETVINGQEELRGILK